jgi:hypothetical protein
MAWVSQSRLIANTKSVYVSAPLVRLVKRQEFELEPSELSSQIKSLRNDVDNENEKRNKHKLDEILEHAPADLKLALRACSEKGASSWVTAVPSYDQGTILHKGEFTYSLRVDFAKPPYHMCLWYIFQCATRA